MGYSQWMSQLGDDVNPAHLAIPGTHDSCAYDIYWAEFALSSVTKTQNRNIQQQLDDGIRFFDIRLSDKMECYHGPIFLDSTFKAVMDTFTAFLTNNTKEALFVSIKHEKGDNAELFYNSLVNDYIKAGKYKDYWSVGPSLPTSLKSIRKKIVLMRRFHIPSGKENLGIDFRSAWSDNALTNTTISGAVVEIQDYYNLLPYWKQVLYGPGITGYFVFKYIANKKVGYINASLSNSVKNVNTWYLNFWSHQFVRSAFVIGIKTLADDVQAQMKAELRKMVDNGTAYHGIFPMDYYTNAVIDLIMKTNFKKC